MRAKVEHWANLEAGGFGSRSPRLEEILHEIKEAHSIHRDSLGSIRDIQKGFKDTLYDIHSDVKYLEAIYNNLTDIRDERIRR